MDLVTTLEAKTSNSLASVRGNNNDDDDDDDNNNNKEMKLRQSAAIGCCNSCSVS